MGYLKEGEYPYTLGRGIVRVKKDGENSWQDLFHVKEFKINITSDSVEHESLRRKLKAVDAEEVTKVKAAGQFVCDVPCVENVLLFLMGESAESVSQASGTWTAEEFTVVKPDQGQELGKKEITVTAITDDSATPVPLVDGVDYVADWKRGIFTPLVGSTLVGAIGDKFRITGTYAEKSISRINAGEEIVKRHIWFAGDAARGRVQDVLGYCILKPNGDLGLIGDEWENFTFDMVFNAHADYQSPVGLVYEDLGAVV